MDEFAEKLLSLLEEYEEDIVWHQNEEDKSLEDFTEWLRQR